MNWYYLSIAIVIGANIAYHLSIKQLHPEINPFFSLAVTYALSMIFSICLIPLFSFQSLRAEMMKLNWMILVLSLGVLFIEVGFLMVYRSGWKMGVASITANSALTLLLLPIGILFFKEHLTLANLIGIGVTLAGIGLMSLR